MRHLKVNKFGQAQRMFLASPAHRRNCKFYGTGYITDRIMYVSADKTSEPVPVMIKNDFKFAN